MKTQKWSILTIGILFSCLISIPVMAQEVRQAIVKDTDGEVMVRLGGSDWTPAEKSMVLKEKDEIKTGEDSSAKLLLDQEGKTGKLHVKEKSLLRFNEMSGAPDAITKTTLLDLAIGKVLVEAEKLKGDSKFEVRTPTSTTGVRGTVFEVEVEEEE